MEALLKQASDLAGREVHVEQVDDGSWIVLWLSFSSSPPPKADTPEKALQGFIDLMLKLKPAVDRMEAEDTTTGDVPDDHGRPASADPGTPAP